MGHLETKRLEELGEFDVNISINFTLEEGSFKIDLDLHFDLGTVFYRIWLPNRRFFDRP